jgi:hypothetical protein
MESPVQDRKAPPEEPDIRGIIMERYDSNKPIQCVIHKYIYMEKSGCIIGITGRPNFGKSWTGNKLIMDFDKSSKIEDYLCYDVPEIFTKTFENIKINGRYISKEEFDQITDIQQWCRENIQHIEVNPGNKIMVDEAGTSIYNREFFSAENKAMSKLVQVWRFLRMLVIFVVPEKMEFLERTLREFFDMKITMVSKNEQEGYAKAYVSERCGRNFKGEPMFKRIEGNRDNGFIRITRLDKDYPEVAEEYEKRSRIYKTSIIMQARRDVDTSNGNVFVEKKGTIKSDIDEIISEALPRAKEFRITNSVGTTKFSALLIQNKMKVGYPTARRIKAALEEAATNQ